MPDAHDWLEEVRAVSVPHVFNPYNSTCPEFDQECAAEVRFALLSETLLAACRTGVRAIWIGRDLGYRGGRRTGLALTDDIHLRAHLERWSVKVPEPYVRGRIVAERTASIVWRELGALDEKIFLWNVFPFHPHDAGCPMSNRAHTSKEREIGEGLLAWLVRLLQPAQLVAIGNDAQKSAVRCALGAKVYPVRHPSYGGQSDFIRGVRSIYNVGSGA
jgi:uracil-DNA glycosylase